MFGAVMVNEEICRDFLEMAVGFPIEKVEISKEKSMIYHRNTGGYGLILSPGMKTGLTIMWKCRWQKNPI